MTPTDASTHRFNVRVYYEDTDAGGIVYHANYLRFAERARTEFLRAAGHDHPSLLQSAGGQFSVVACSMRFRAPARLDDLLTVVTERRAGTGARLALAQNVTRAGLSLVEIEVELAFVSLGLRPRRLPPSLRSPATSAD